MPAVLEKLAWVYEQQREWRAALDVWRELPPEKQRERAAVAAHYCCELGEAALAAGDFAAARAQVAAARAHHAAARARRMLAARIAAASGDDGKALELYSAALGASRTMLVAFEAEAHEALQSRGGDARLTTCFSIHRRTKPCHARAGAISLRGVWRRQRHLALALPELPQLGFPAKHE